MNFLLSILLILTFNPLYHIWGKCTICIGIFGYADLCGCTLNTMLSENYIGTANKALALVTASFIAVSFAIGLLSFFTYFHYKENAALDISWKFITLISLILIIIFFSNCPILLGVGILYLIIFLFSLIYQYAKCKKTK